MFDKKKFKAAVNLSGKRMKDVAALLQIDVATLCRKMNGESDFFRAEIDILRRELAIKNADEIFFAQNLRKRKFNEKDQMKDIEVFAFKHQSVVDSRGVADVIERTHYDLMKSIRQYSKHLTKGKISVSDFFIPTTYTDETGRTLPCFYLTRKGCDLVANKMTGEKGTLFTAAYVTRFHEMDKELTKRAALRELSEGERLISTFGY